MKVVGAFLISLGWGWLLIPAPVTAKELSLAILYSNTTNGVLQGCNCPHGGNGGLGRRLTVIRQQRSQEKNILLVDSGDLFLVMPDSAKSALMLDIVKRMKYDFITFGDQEFVNGIDFIKHHIDQGEWPFYSATLKYIDTRNNSIYPLVPPYKIEEVGGRKVGIIGVVCPEAFRFFPGLCLFGMASVFISLPARAQTGRTVEEARKYLGVPFAWEGRGRQGLDCLGLVFRAHAGATGKNWKKFPVSAWAMLAEKTFGAPAAGLNGVEIDSINYALLKPGDIVHFLARDKVRPDWRPLATVRSVPLYAHHIGICAGDSIIIHANPYGEPRLVREEKLRDLSDRAGFEAVVVTRPR